ncbi:amidohydrolase family protein [Sulfitobacter sp. S190]|nr:amidohydrolase family protein [Sulfitobacter sp. S190]
MGGTPAGDCLRGVPVVENGKLRHLRPGAPEGPAPLILPPLTEAHCHLDKCHTIYRMGAVAGDLKQAIAAQRADKQHWTADDLRQRARRGISEARAAGTRTLRTHVDWGDTPEAPLAWEVFAELAADTPDLTLQRACLVGIEDYADPDFVRPLVARIAADGGVLGAFVHGQDRMIDGIRALFRAASEAGLPVDFHVDEGLGDLNGLEAIADAARDVRFNGPILCGHAVSLMDRAPDDVARIIDKLAHCGASVCALPTTNLYLQDRRSGTPDRRGLTRLRELRKGGVPVLTASDNIADAFCPMGQFDPMAALHLAALGAHLDPPMADWLPMITTDARAALGLPVQMVEDLDVGDLMTCAVEDTNALVAGRAPLVQWRDAAMRHS